ncbi:MAG TPA: enoyl-CoA hydratase-related protein [Candidatus Dormibacteraeota bacterium]|jgi:2-(1,2-epoxy-1,2-dihydrophenyl)acetyl-CoA isomerase
MSDLLLSERTGRVLTLTMNRPDALNALNQAATRELRKAFEAAGRDPEVGSVILTGAGRAFCTGADLREVSGRYDAGDTQLGEDLRRNYSPLIRAIRSCAKPVIAAINGTAAGAGLSLALACDIRLAASTAQLIVVFIRVGLVPDAGSLFFLTRIFGLSKATEMAMTGDAMSADEAHRLGAIAAVVPPDQLMAIAMERASRLAEGPSKTYGLIKRGLDRALDLDLDQTLELESHLQTLAAKTADHREAVKAFLEKRKPVFKG